MSLLDELRGLNLDAIVSARASISASVSAPEMSGLVSTGAASSALGSLGGNLDSLRQSFPDAAALIRPLVEALAQLGGRFDAGRLPIGEYTAAVREGMEFISRLTASVGGNPSDFGQIFGTPLAEAVRIAGDRSGEMTRLLGAGADGFADVTRLVSQDIRDPRALADLVLDVLLPIPRAHLRSLREHLDLIVASSAQFHLPQGRASGLVAALDAVSTAAASGDVAAISAALRTVAQVRAHFVGVVRDDLLFATQQLSQIRVPDVMRPFVELSQTVRLGQDGVIQYLDEFRTTVRAVRAQMDTPDFDTARTFIRSLPALIEARARAELEQPIDHAVERAKAFVRRTLRELPVRSLRNEVTRFLHDIVQAVDEANLDGPATAARNALRDVGKRLDPAALTGEVQQALQRVNASITDALDDVIAALDQIQTAVDGLAGQAESILHRLADGLEAFRQAIDGTAAAIDGLGIEQVEQRLVDALTALRETASEVLANVPLPEPLRPQVEQLIDLLEGVDFDEVFDPVRDAVAELRIPDDVAGTVEEGLREAQRVVQNLIPAELIASIQHEVDAALATIGNFNPASLLPDVSQYLESAANAVEQLDARAVAEEIRGPFQAVLDAVDRAHPSRVLAPVIEAYDSLLRQVPVPDGETTVKGLRGAFDAAGRVAARAALEPARRATGNAESSIADPEATPTSPELPPPASDVRAGDAIRLLGVVPAKLRALLANVGTGPLGEVLVQVDALCGGLARQIRQLEGSLHDVARRLDEGVDQTLAPVGPSHLRAQLAIQVRFAGQASLQGSLDALAMASPSALRRELADTVGAARGTARHMASGAGGSVGASLERIAVALEATPLARLAGDVDGLLAALDPEPIALELDALATRIVELTPQLAAALLPDLRALVDRLRALIDHYNPGAQAQKFLAVIDVVREEMDVLDPRRLAMELGEIHAAIRATIAAYDPRVLAEELAAITRNLAQGLRSLNPQTLLGDLTFLQAAVDRVAAANPATRLATVGASLTGVGARLGAVDLDALIASVNALGPRVVESFEALIEAVRNEIVALLQSLRFAMASAGASVSAEVSVG